MVGDIVLWRCEPENRRRQGRRNRREPAAEVPIPVVEPESSKGEEKSGQISKTTEDVSTEVMNFEILRAQKIFDALTVFELFSPKKSILFSVFFYDLEISETFKNDTRNATIRLQNIALIFSVFFLNRSSDPPVSRKWVGE